MSSITIEGNIVHEQRTNNDGRIVCVTHTCASRRVAQVTATRIDLESKGWAVSGIGAGDDIRLPLLLPGEKMGQP